jgi:hypothetical protein
MEALMKDTKTITKLINDLELQFEHGTVDENMEFFEITIDESEGLNVSGLLYEAEEGAAFRLLAYMDELDEDHALDQLSLLMALNGELPIGAFCMDPEEQIIYSTVNLPVSDLTAELLSWLLEYVFAVQDFYYQEYATVDEGEN